jgi:hypothetical protein
MIYLLHTENGLKFAIDMKHIEEKFDILTRNGFLQTDYVVGKDDRSCVKLQAFDCKEDLDFVSYVMGDLFSHDGLNFMDEETKNRMIHNLLEVYANVEHARTDRPIFACGQYFPKGKRLKFTLVDLGVGFLQPINEFTNGKVSKPEDAINWALREGATIRTDAPGGNGLSDLRNYCDQTKSHLSIMTDGVLWGTDLGIMEFCPVGDLHGTVITLDFNCN